MQGARLGIHVSAAHETACGLERDHMAPFAVKRATKAQASA
jgi:hypothetical protein